MTNRADDGAGGRRHARGLLRRDSRSGRSAVRSRLRRCPQHLERSPRSPPGSGRPVRGRLRRHATRSAWRRSEGLALAVRAGGHSIPGFSTCDDGIVLDLSLMRGIRVDPERRRVSIQTGCVWRDVDVETQQFNLAVTGGLVSSTGVAGFTLGGGIGWLTRQCGLTVDNLVGADVITADGQWVSTRDDPDLLWGLQGGGGNFGVVTSLDLALHDVGPTVFAGLVFYPAARGRRRPARLPRAVPQRARRPHDAPEADDGAGGGVHPGTGAGHPGDRHRRLLGRRPGHGRCGDPAAAVAGPDSGRHLCNPQLSRLAAGAGRPVPPRPALLFPIGVPGRAR